MNPPIIHFKTRRELGTVISDLFRFVRFQGKDLLTYIIRYAGPAFLFVVGSYIYYVQNTMGNFENIFNSSSLTDFSFSLILSLFLFMISLLVFYALLYTVVLCYIDGYIQNNGKVPPEFMRRAINKQYWNMLLLQMANGIIIFFGLILCFLPGIYLAVVLTISAPILIFEEKNVTDSISKSFQLIKNEWFMSFATFFVIYILYYIVMIVFQLPQIIYYFIKAFTINETAGGNPFEIVDWFSISLEVISMTFQHLLFSLIIISFALVYYHLNELKNNTGAIESIDRLGKR